MATVPFAKMKLAMTSERLDRETRQDIYEFLKAIVGRGAYKCIQEYDRAMVGEPRQRAAEIAMGVVRDNPLNSEFILGSFKISMLALIAGDCTVDGPLRDLLVCFAKAAAKGETAVVLFTVKHLGRYVAYNTTDPVNISVPRIIIPGHNLHQQAITIMPLKSYKRMWDIKRGEINE